MTFGVHTKAINLEAAAIVALVLLWWARATMAVRVDLERRVLRVFCYTSAPHDGEGGSEYNVARR